MKHILISYDYFYPGYKAGGPIQSLVNLVHLLQDDFRVSVFTSAYDLNVLEAYNDVTINQWNKVLLPGTNILIDIWYADTNNLRYKDVINIIQEVKPDIIYINSIYSLKFLIYPILVIRKLAFKTKIVICPRGMLQKGALEVKSLKKKIFLKCFQLSMLLNNICWHATNEEEKSDIVRFFPLYKMITVASNIPKLPINKFENSRKRVGELNLVYLSLISEKKNLHLLLQVIINISTVTLDIYGPIKDKNYWEDKCLPLLNNLEGRVAYKGDLKPIDVQQTLVNYDALALLTKGENFGHALYESLSVGRPIITSFNTPWKDLEKKNAGWNVDINNIDQIVDLMKEIAKMESSDFELYTKGSYDLAKEYYYNQNFKISYAQCFN